MTAAPARPPLRWVSACLLTAALLLHGSVLLPAPGWADEDAPAPAAPPKTEPATRLDPLVIGTYAIDAKSVVDGDTLRTVGAKKSIRIPSIDTEEVFRKDDDRKAAAQDFAAYARAKRGEDPHPVKYGTPAGEAAKVFVQALLKDVKQVRLERDSEDAPERGNYGRTLAHVFLLTPTGEVNFSEAVIRAGHSPYFYKYGRSKRFDDVFRKAEADARKAKRGIWSETGPAHYPDYEERCRWWTARVEQIERWQKDHADKPDHVTLGAPGSDAKLQKLLGQEATVFGAIQNTIQGRNKDRWIFFLPSEKHRSFGLVVFDKAVYEALDLKALLGMNVTALGKISLYKGRPQMVLQSAEALRVAPK